MWGRMWGCLVVFRSQKDFARKKVGNTVVVTCIVQTFRRIFGLHLPDKWMYYNLLNKNAIHWKTLLTELEYFMIMSRQISNFVASRLFSVKDRWLSACLNCSLEFGLWKLRDDTYCQTGGKVQVLSTLSLCCDHTAGRIWWKPVQCKLWYIIWLRNWISKV
jgi:hypothetical protein